MIRSNIFFDLDGTLTDPKPGITRSIQYALERLGATIPTEEELIWSIGPPLIESFRQLVGDAQAQAGVDYYRERFSTVGLFENEPYPDITKVLQQLTERGQSLYVASSKPVVFVNRILDHFQLSPYFNQVFGSELDGTRTDKTELLTHALAKTGHRADHSTMIGDRSHDAVGAHNNNMSFVGVLYGYGSITEFQAAGAKRWVHRPSDLLDVLRD